MGWFSPAKLGERMVSSIGGGLEELRDFLPELRGPPGRMPGRLLERGKPAIKVDGADVFCGRVGRRVIEHLRDYLQVHGLDCVQSTISLASELVRYRERHTTGRAGYFGLRVGSGIRVN